MDVYPRWKGKPLVPTRRAQEEMDSLGLDLRKLAEMLERAVPSGARRKEGVYEMCVGKGEKGIKIVVVESLQYSTRELVWLVTHVGIYKR